MLMTVFHWQYMCPHTLRKKKKYIYIYDFPTTLGIYYSCRGQSSIFLVQPATIVYQITTSFSTCFRVYYTAHSFLF